MDAAAPRMRAMVLVQVGEPLVEREVLRPVALPGELLLRVRACGVCRTDLHIVDGELTRPKLPLIPGHEIVGEVAGIGAGVTEFQRGDRVGVPWLAETCGVCEACRRGDENLCDGARFTGYDRDGGYAEYTTARASSCFPIPEAYSDVEAAPLLCAGLIGYRSLRMAGEGRRLGIYGFGAAAHLVAQVARHQGREVFAFTRAGDAAAQDFARECGAVWAGGSDDRPPVELDAAILFAPVGALVPQALQAVRKGGVVVCGGIHMSDIPSFPYAWLWGERVIRSVANLTHRDGSEFLKLAPDVPVRCSVESFPFAAANEALTRLREGRLTGAAVLVPGKGRKRIASRE
jgi:propanol-preferring alcohol dehydrogenase